MTYEEFLDEVATLLTENYDLSDGAAIKCVVRAQAEGFFIPHDEDPARRTQVHAEQDAALLYKQRSQVRSTSRSANK